MHVVREPDPEATLAFLQSELRTLSGGRGRIVQVFAACTVDYTGRAASTLDHGERLVMLKPDGTFLVHTAEKAKPVNWMPPGQNETTVAFEDGGVVLTVLRRKPHHEVVRVRLKEVRLLVSVPLSDPEELVLKRTEGDLHRLFFENPELIEAGLVIRRGEKDTRRGPLDLWGEDAGKRRVVIEVKRSKAGIQEATQLWRYVELERQAVQGAPTGSNGHVDPHKVRGILISPGLSQQAARMLADHGLEHVTIEWDRLLAHMEAPRAAGQSTLGRFTDGLNEKTPEQTVRTGKRRTR